MFVNFVLQLTLLFIYTRSQSNSFYLEVLSGEKTLGYVQHRSDELLVVTPSQFDATLFSDGKSLEPKGFVPVNDPELGPQPGKETLVLFDHTDKAVCTDEEHRLVTKTESTNILGWYAQHDPVGYDKLDVANHVICKFQTSDELYHAVFTENIDYNIQNCESVKLKKVCD